MLQQIKDWLSNKDNVIKTAAGVLGAVAGILVAGLLQEGLAEQEGDLPEWMLEEGDEETEESTEEE